MSGHDITNLTSCQLVKGQEKWVYLQNELITVCQIVGFQ